MNLCFFYNNILFAGKNRQEGCVVVKKRTVIRLFSYCLAISVFLLGLLIKVSVQNSKYRLQLENDYSSALSELDAGLNNISLILQKSAYSSSASQISSYAAELFCEAELAKSALSKLTGNSGSFDNLYLFLSQVGNFALAVSKNVISGNEVSTQEKENLQKLSKIASNVIDVITQAQITLNNIEYWSNEVEARLQESGYEGALSQSLAQLDDNLVDFPTLIYDGPYSSHILNKEPLMIKENSAVSDETAFATATAFLGGDAENLEFEENENGKISCYRFSNETASVSVSKLGGYVVYMRKNRQVAETRFSYEQALGKAKKFMSDNGFENMIDTYYYSDEGVCVINFAYLDGQTICYTDLMKVGVALDNGEIMLYEAAGYLTNHTERAFEVPTFTAEKAAERLSKSLTIEETSIVLIPTPAGKEVRCYEFLCLAENGEEILVYINTTTLEEEQIYILLKSDGGTLVK